MRRLLTLIAFAALAFAADISGKWTFDVETDLGSGTPTFVFKQDGEKLTGNLQWATWRSTDQRACRG